MSVGIMAVCAETSFHSTPVIRSLLTALCGRPGEGEKLAYLTSQLLTRPSSDDLGTHVNTDAEQSRLNARVLINIVLSDPPNDNTLKNIKTDIAGILSTSNVWATRRLVPFRQRERRSEASIERVAFAKRLPRLDHDSYMEHYQSTHVPLVLGHDPLFRRYVINEVLEDSAALDTVTQQEFESHDAWIAHDRALLEDKPAVSRDLPNFLGSVQQFIGTDKIVARVG